MFNRILGVVLLLLGVITFIVIDPVLAWDDANEYIGKGRMFLYFTTQSNLLTVAAYVVFGIAFVRGRAATPGMELLRGLATVDMAITGIVNGVLLADPTMPWTFSDFVLHQGGPLAIVIWWVVLPPVRRLPFGVIGLWLLHPAIWTASILTYAAESSDNWYPYFFMNPAKVDGWGGVFTFVLAIHVIIAVLSVGAIALSRAPWRREIVSTP